MLVELVDLLVHKGCVGSRGLIDEKEHTRHTVHERGHGIGLRTDLYLRYVLEVQHRTVVLGTQHDVLKLLDALERTFVLHRVLERVLGLLTERTGSGHETLGIYSGSYIVRHESVLSHHFRVQPYTQRVRVT